MTRFSESQRQVIETWGKGLAVMAGAGSGKTTTLVAKCEALLRRQADARFVAVSFTERSASDLRLKLSSKMDISSHWVMTIHGLCGVILRENAREAGMDGEERVLSESESQDLWSRAWDTLWMSQHLDGALEKDIERLLAREGRSGLENAILRVRSLVSFGILDFLKTSQSEDEGALGRLTEWLLNRYEKLKSRQGALDFDDLEKYAERVLRDQSVCQRYQQKFDLVLVDEFQDTNPIQSRILKAFARPDRSNLCVVGDPKQSIYRFRGADVSVFEEFCQELPVQITLTQNFRSRPGVIEFVNQTCESIFLESDLRYDALEAQREQTDPSVGSSVEVLSEWNEIELARWLKQKVREEGVDWGRYALLLRKIRGNEGWIRALAAEGIPLAVGSGGLFWSDPRVREMVALLRWWQDPVQHRLSGAIFLRAPWMGISDSVLDEWQRQDPTWQAPFFSSSHPLAQKLLLLRGKEVRPGEVLIELLGEDAWEIELGAPALGLWHRVEELSHSGMTFFHVVQEISRDMQDEKRERDVPPPRNLGQLSVLTIHSSKGLEFDQVILVDFPSQPPRGRGASILYWNRHRGVYLMPRDTEGHRDDRSEEAQRWKDFEKSQELAESKRVFYVALTRAREKLILVLPPGDPPRTMKEPAPKLDYWRGWIDPCVTDQMKVDRSILKNLTLPDVAPTHAEKLRQKPMRLQIGSEKIRWVRPRHSVTEWALFLRCPRRYVAELQNPNPMSFDEKSQQTAAEIGTRVHRALELEHWDDLSVLEAEVGAQRFRAQPVLDWARSSELGMMREGVKIWSELAFEVPVAGEVLVGAMDRVVYDEQKGLYTVVDFKVTSEKKVSHREALMERYTSQLALYAWALGQVEPQAEGKTQACLVAITPVSVTSFDVSHSDISNLKVESVAQQTAAIVAALHTDPLGELSVPARPGRVCEDCPVFKKSCHGVA